MSFQRGKLDTNKLISIHTKRDLECSPRRISKQLQKIPEEIEATEQCFFKENAGKLESHGRQRQIYKKQTQQDHSEIEYVNTRQTCLAMR